MPFINVKTNIPVSENAQEALKTRLGQAIEAIPGKSDAYDALTARVCELLDAVLDIDPARVYVKYAETPNWGWNGGNF